MKYSIILFITLFIVVITAGFSGSLWADSSEPNAKETGKQIWKSLKSDLKEVNDTIKEQGKKAGKGAKRNLKEAKQTAKQLKKETVDAKKDAPNKSEQ